MPMTGQLEGKVIVVTGAGRGIGRASALRLAEAGATIVVTDVLREQGEETAAQIRSTGSEALFRYADMAVESEIKAVIDETITNYGRLDGALNNAAILQRGKPMLELTTEEWELALRIDLTAVFLCMKYEMLAMLQTGGGAIVNTASALGQVAVAGASEYVAAKHGVLGLTRAAAADYGSQGIRTNAIMPGIIESFVPDNLDDYVRQLLSRLKERHPIGRFGQPSEIGDAVCWLLSDQSSFVNGAAIAVDGGYLAV